MVLRTWVYVEKRFGMYLKNIYEEVVGAKILNVDDRMMKYFLIGSWGKVKKRHGL